ncbi:SDR family NAD(P)-dependent oxidoreductase [Nocardia sp. NPDC057440]|uniref:SDR family NAD(P)-dependent oxidoreductase n=1 Tax=Nocardia sp. NPDC057440 TaxID=3346134 RepID=UPI00366A6384
MTGASAGIGRVFATTLAAAGYSVTAVARGKDALEELMTELGDGHDNLVADLATEDGLQVVVAALRAGGYTLLVNNAGTATHGSFTDIPLESALTTLDLNCRAVVVLAHAFLAEAAPGSALVNVSSTLGHTPKPGMSVYSASKAFVTTFSETLWHEQKSRGVKVLALCPGVTATSVRAVEDVPSWLLQSPEQVVHAARKALSGKSGPVTFTSRTNRMFVAVLCRLPRRVALSALAH